MRPATRVRRPVRGHSIIAWANDLVDQVIKRITIIGDKKTIAVRKIGRGYQITALAQPGIDPTFAVSSITGAVVTVAAGYIKHGSETPVEVEETEVEVTGGTTAAPHYIVLEYNADTRVGIIYASAWATQPASEPPNIYRCTLHAVARSGASAVHVRPHQVGDINYPLFA